MHRCDAQGISEDTLLKREEELASRIALAHPHFQKKMRQRLDWRPASDVDDALGQLCVCADQPEEAQARQPGRWFESLVEILAGKGAGGNGGKGAQFGLGARKADVAQAHDVTRQEDIEYLALTVAEKPGRAGPAVLQD